MSSACDSDASFPVLVAAADAGAMCAIGGGRSSRRNRARHPPPLFFLSFSAVASDAAGCRSGGAHSSVRAAAASFADDSCCGAGAPHGLAFAGGSLGFAVGAHVFAGASFDAGGAVIHDSAGAPGAGALGAGAPGAVAAWAGTPPPGARHQSLSFGLVCGVCGACGAGAFAAGPGAKRPESEESRLSTAGGTSTPGADSGAGPNPPMRCAISACRSSRTAGAGGAASLGAGASGSFADQSGALVDQSCAGWARSSLAGSDSCHAGADLLRDQSCVGAWVSSATGGGDHSCVGGAGSGSDGALGSGAPGCATADLFSAGGNASITPSFTRPERRVR